MAAKLNAKIRIQFSASVTILKQIIPTPNSAESGHRGLGEKQKPQDTMIDIWRFIAHRVSP